MRGYITLYDMTNRYEITTSAVLLMEKYIARLPSLLRYAARVLQHWAVLTAGLGTS